MQNLPTEKQLESEDQAAAVAVQEATSIQMELEGSAIVDEVPQSSVAPKVEVDSMEESIPLEYELE